MDKACSTWDSDDESLWGPEQRTGPFCLANGKGKWQVANGQRCRLGPLNLPAWCSISPFTFCFSWIEPADGHLSSRCPCGCSRGCSPLSLPLHLALCGSRAIEWPMVASFYQSCSYSYCQIKLSRSAWVKMNRRGKGKPPFSMCQAKKRLVMHENEKRERETHWQRGSRKRGEGQWYKDWYPFSSSSFCCCWWRNSFHRFHYCIFSL